jgi:hypothetical protein
MHSKATRASSDVPHSWDLPNWPNYIWPGNGKRARWLIRAYRDDLMRSGALVRTGKTLVILGRGYAAWLEQRAAHVPGYLSNNPDMRKAPPA